MQIDGIVTVKVSSSESCPTRRAYAADSDSAAFAHLDSDANAVAAEERGLSLPAERRAATDFDAAVLLDCSARAWADVTFGIAGVSVKCVGPVPRGIF